MSADRELRRIAVGVVLVALGLLGLRRCLCGEPEACRCAAPCHCAHDHDDAWDDESTGR